VHDRTSVSYFVSLFPINDLNNLRNFSFINIQSNRFKPDTHTRARTHAHAGGKMNSTKGQYRE